MVRLKLGALQVGAIGLCVWDENLICPDCGDSGLGLWGVYPHGPKRSGALAY